MNYRPGIPRYLQIAEALRRELRGEGERIPSEHQLCAQYKVSRPTIRQALDVLVQEGRLYRHAGRGYLQHPDPGGDRKLRVIGSVDDLIALGDESWFKPSGARVVRVPANIAQALRLPPGSEAYRVMGVRHADDGPFQHVTAYLPWPSARRCPMRISPRPRSSAAIERQLGVPIKLLDQVTDAVLAPRHVAELLQVRSRTPLLLFERTYFAVSGEPVEHAISYQAGRRYPFRVVCARPERRS